MCLRNTTAGITAWRVNDSAAVSVSDIAIAFPGHTRNSSTAGSTLWCVNGSGALTALTPTDLVAMFPGHTLNGVNLIIVNATNNIEYICVSNVDNVCQIDSTPVYLFVADTYICCITIAMILYLHPLLKI